MSFKYQKLRDRDRTYIKEKVKSRDKYTCSEIPYDPDEMTASNYISICANNTSVTKLDTCMIVGGQSGFLFRDSKPHGRHWIFFQNQSGETRHL